MFLIVIWFYFIIYFILGGEEILGGVNSDIQESCRFFKYIFICSNFYT